MSIIIDIIILAILALCILWGYHKGLTGSLLKIISFVLALVVAFVFFKPVSSLVINSTNWDENLEQSIRNMVLQNEGQATETQDNEEDSKNQNMPNVMVNYINDAVEKAGDDAKNAIVDATAKEVSITIINAGVWVALFLIARIVLMFIKGLAKIITELPLIKQVDKLGGIIYGLIEALIIIYIILAVISFASPLMSGTGVIDGIQDSHLGNSMYNNNLLLKIIF